MLKLRNINCTVWLLTIVVLSFLHLHCPNGAEAPNSPRYEIAEFFSTSAIPISFNRIQFGYSGQFTQSPKGQPIYVINLLQIQRGFLPEGDLKIKGKITPFTPGSPIPSKMRVSFRHKNSQNVVLRTKNFDFNVAVEGGILLQTVPHRDLILFAPKDILEISVVPVDKAFPAGTANLTINYVPPPAGTTGKAKS